MMITVDKAILIFICNLIATTQCTQGIKDLGEMSFTSRSPDLNEVLQERSVRSWTHASRFLGSQPNVRLQSAHQLQCLRCIPCHDDCIQDYHVNVSLCTLINKPNIFIWIMKAPQDPVNIWWKKQHIDLLFRVLWWTFFFSF